MADIEKWITVNGAHIPIIKGESRTKAIANFIKRKRNKRLNKEYYKQKMAGKSWREANEAIRQKIKGRAKTRDEVEDERFDKYDEYAHNVAKNLRYDNRNNPLTRDELYDQAHEIAMRASLNDIDRKYGRAGTNPNRQVGVYFNPRKGKESIRRAEYKLKTGKETPAKRTIKGVGKTASMKQADKDYERALKKTQNQINSRPFYSSQSKYDKDLEKLNRNLGKKIDAQTKAYTYNMTDTNRQKLVKSLSDKSAKLDRKMSTASGKEFDRLAKEYEKNQKKLNTLGGKYIVGRKKKK